jgi:DNA-binding Lrp family transcriptional regulator
MKLPPGTRVLRSPEAIELVSSPLRLELLEHLRQAGQASTADLARLMGRPATALHYHVKRLWQAGLLRAAGRRPAGKRGEALYALSAVRFAVIPTTTVSRRAVVRTLGATLRLAQREAGRALHTEDARGSGPTRNLHIRRLRAPLGEAAQAEVNRLLDSLERLFEREMRRGARERTHGGEALSLTFVLAPAGRKPPREDRR